MTISERIKTIRLEKGLKQKEVADKVGVEQSYYSKLERTAGNRVYIDVLFKICKALDVSVYDVLSVDNEVKPSSSQDQEVVNRKKLEKIRHYMERVTLEYAFNYYGEEIDNLLFNGEPRGVVLARENDLESIQRKSLAAKAYHQNNYHPEIFAKMCEELPHELMYYRQHIEVPMQEAFDTVENLQNWLKQQEGLFKRLVKEGKRITAI